MIADRLLAVLWGRTGFRVTRWSLVRIACVTALTLAVSVVVVPDNRGDLGEDARYYNQFADPAHTRVVSLELGDPRGFCAEPHSDRFRTAWIGGSELIGVDPEGREVVPSLVTERIRSVDGRRPATDVYFLNAIRLADQLAALKQALTTEPDLVVVSLNPVWVLNDLAAQQWSYLDAVLARGTFWPPSSWPVAASLLSPGDFGWRALASVSTVIEDRLHWGTQLGEKTDGLSVLHPIPGRKERPPVGLGVLAATRPVDFWARHYEPVPAGANVADQQLNLFARGLRSPSGLMERILREMFASARRAHVDAYFYLPAISPELYAAPDGRRYVTELQRRLAEITRTETNDRVVFDANGLQNRVPATPYNDIIHKLDPRPEAGVLSADLCSFLERRGHRAECEQP